MATKGPVPEIVDPMIDPRTGEYAVIAPGHTFKSVTQKIAGIVLTSNTPVAWMGGLFLAGDGCDGRRDRGDVAGAEGRRNLGHHDSGRVGICDHQLRVVDRYRPCGHADLGDSAAVQADAGATRSTDSRRR